MITSPGPFTFQNRPNVNTTPRSYSRKIRTALNKNTTAKTTMTASPIHPNPHSSCFSLFRYRFDCEYQSVDACHAYQFAALERNWRAHFPRLALYTRICFAAGAIDDFAGRVDHLLAAADHRLPARTQREVQHDKQKCGACRS